MKLYLLLVVAVGVIAVQGVSEDENQDVMEEDDNFLMGATVNAEEDLQDDDFTANDVEADPAAKRKIRKCRRGLHLVCHTLPLCRYIKKKRKCRPRRVCFCGCRRGFRIACRRSVCGCIRRKRVCAGGAVRACKRYRLCKKFKGSKRCVRRRFCPCRCRRGHVHYCRRKGRAFHCKCQRKSSKCRRGEKRRCKRISRCIAHKGYKHCELITGCMCSRVKRG
eukprot:Seg3707.1 transcript_id=Seg3707.1/GoldUCD/mRNA.D3Y31 product="hypothetical protein" protein_id=Seg3707.1/GoldUCD/D3Y31